MVGILQSECRYGDNVTGEKDNIFSYFVTGEKDIFSYCVYVSCTTSVSTNEAREKIVIVLD